MYESHRLYSFPLISLTNERLGNATTGRSRERERESGRVSSSNYFPLSQPAQRSASARNQSDWMRAPTRREKKKRHFGHTMTQRPDRNERERERESDGGFTARALGTAAATAVVVVRGCTGAGSSHDRYASAVQYHSPGLTREPLVLYIWGSLTLWERGTERARPRW